MDEENRQHIQKILRNLSCVLLFSAFILKIFTVFQYVNLHVATIFIWGAFIFLCFYLCLEKQIFSENHVLYLALFIFIIIAATSTSYAHDYESAMNLTLTWFTNILFFVSIAFWCRDYNVWHTFVAIILASFCVELLYGLYQYFIDLPALRLEVKEAPEVLNAVKNSVSRMGMFNARLQNERIFGHFLLPNTYGIYLCILIPFLFVLTKNYYNSCRRYFAFFVVFFLLAVVNVYMTKSKGSILSLFIVMGIYLLLYLRSKWKAKGFLVFIVTMFVFSSAFAYLICYSGIFDFIGNNSTTFLNRTEYWQASLQIWQQSPFVGIGINNFPEYFYAVKPMWLEEVNNAHNFYIQYMTETGIVGLFSLIFLGFVLGKRLSLPTVTTSATDNELFKYSAFVSVFLAMFFIYLSGVFTIDYSDVNYLSKIFAFDIPVTVLEVGFFLIAIAIFVFLISLVGNQDLRLITMKSCKIGIGIFLLHAFIDIDFYVHNLNLFFWALVAVCVAQTDYGDRPVLVWRKKVATFILLLCIFFQLYMLMNISQRLDKHNYLQISQKFEQEMNSVRSSDEYQRLVKDYYTHLEKALNAFPDDVDQRLRMGVVVIQNLLNHLQRYSVQTNIEEMNKFINLIKIAEEHVVYVETSNTYLKIKHLTSMCHFYLTEASIWKQLRQSNREREARKKALELVERSLKLYPHSASLSLLCAEILEELNLRKEALAMYRQTLLISDTVYPWAYGVEPEKKQEIYQKVSYLLKLLASEEEK